MSEEEKIIPDEELEQLEYIPTSEPIIATFKGILSKTPVTHGAEEMIVEVE